MSGSARRRMPRFSSSGAERTIAATRVTLAAVSLFAIWLDPAEPARFAAVTYALHTAYVVYSVLIAALVWSRVRPGWLPLSTHIADLVVFSVFQYLTTGPSSPFFMYFVFALFCAALRWGWPGTLRTIPAVVGSFVLIGASMSRELGPTEFELNRFIIRIGYLTMVGVLLVYLGRHEADRRGEILRLARWPTTDEYDDAEAMRVVLTYASGLLEADVAVAAWFVNDEPRATVAHWTPSGFDVTMHGPDEVEPLVPEELEPYAFVCAGVPAGEPNVIVQRGARVDRWQGTPMHPSIAMRLAGPWTGSAAFQTDRLSGRVFFAWQENPTAAMLPLVEAVTRQVGASLDQLSARAEQQRLAIGEERVKLARNLHDGVLQSLTGVRFELQRLARALTDASSDTRDRLLAMERALAIDQREMRLFIEGLKPFGLSASAGSLPQHLEDLRKRLSVQWHVPIDMHFGRLPESLSPDVEDAMVPLVKEALVNALKHGHPSRIRVTVQPADGGLEVVVVDDGRGFDFEGYLDHEKLAARDLGPASLRDRVTSLGGRLTVTSSGSGARVEMVLPCPPSET